MSMQRVCNTCGEPIDESLPFWTGQVTKVVTSTDPTVPVDMPVPVQFDYHDEHLPDDIRPSEPPVVSTLNPSSANEGDADLHVHVMGTGYIEGAVITYDGDPVSTNWYDATHLSTVLPAARLATAGNYPITVRNPNGGESGAMTFVVGPIG